MRPNNLLMAWVSVAKPRAVRPNKAPASSAQPKNSGVIGRTSNVGYAVWPTPQARVTQSAATAARKLGNTAS